MKKYIFIIMLVLLSSFTFGALVDNNINYYKFDINSGTQVDSISANNAAVSGTTFTALGKINNAYDYDGISDHMTITDITTNGEFSFSFWVKIDNWHTGYAMILGHSSNAHYMGVREVVGVDTLIVNIAAERKWTLSTNIIGDGDYHFVVFTRDGANDIRAYLDGVEIGSPIGQIGEFTLDQFGAYQNSIFFDGSLDEISYWTRTITPAEIAYLNASGNPTALQQYDYTGTSTNFSINLVYPTNETHYNLVNPLDPSKVFNGSLVTTTGTNSNCTNMVNSGSQVWNNITTSTIKQVYTNYTAITEKNYSVTINCSDGTDNASIDFWFIVDNTNVITSINLVNNSIQANEFNLDVSYFDNYLYRTNTTILRMSDNLTIFNNDSGVLGYETEWVNNTFPINLLNSTYIVGDYIKVILNGVDTHTAKKFKEKPKGEKLTIFDRNIKRYNLKHGEFRLEYPLDVEITEDHSFDRMHFKIKDKKFKDKKFKDKKSKRNIDYNSFQYVEGDKIVYYEDSKYPCHMIVNDNYWYDCVGMKKPIVTKERENRYRIDFVLDEEEIITKSLGGLNEVYEEYFFQINKNYTGNISKGDFFNPIDKNFNYTSLYNFTVSSLLVDEDCITIMGSNVSSYSKKYCYNFNNIELEDVVLFAGATDVECYVNISNSTGQIIQTNFNWNDKNNNILKKGFNLCDSNSFCTLDDLSGSLIPSNDSITCEGIINNSWFNFSKNSNTINTSEVGLCNNISLVYPIVNFSYFDELNNDVINVSASYDLTFYEGSSSFNIQSNGTGEHTTFCTDVNPSTAVFNLKLYNTIILSSPNYITRVFNIPFSQGLDVSNNPYYNYSYYLIQVANSTTITYNWEDTEYAAISGIMQIYRCEDDGTRTLIESTNVANGKATANLQLFSTAYSYSFTKDGVTYTEPEYYDCHVESTELQSYTVNIAQIDVLPVVGLYLMDCHIYNVSSSIVTMEWDGNDEDATDIYACIVGYREDIYGKVKVYESCVNQSSGSLTRNIGLTGFNYYVQGTLEQSGIKGFCQETVVFNQRGNTSETFGINGIFLAAILICALALLAAGDNILVIIFSIVAVLTVWLIGIISFSWITVSSIIIIGIILTLVYRFTLKGV